MGFNDVLMNTLVSLSEDNMLSSWSVFQEKNGQISVKIRFEATKESANHDIVAQYRKKPPQQVRRDRERTEAWRARSSRLGQAPQSDKPAQSSLPPGDVPAQHVGIQTRSKVKAANVHTSTPEICRSESTPTIPTMDMTVEPLITENVACDSSVLCPDTVLSDIDSDSSSTRSNEEHDMDEVCDGVASHHEYTRNDSSAPENPPPWWNKMVEEMNTDIQSMSARLCATPSPD